MLRRCRCAWLLALAPAFLMGCHLLGPRDRPPDGADLWPQPPPPQAWPQPSYPLPPPAAGYPGPASAPPEWSKGPYGSPPAVAPRPPASPPVPARPSPAAAAPSYGPAVQPTAEPAIEPPYDPAAAHRAVAFAHSMAGKPYCWGGTGPECFDCSGLVTASWRTAGRRLPRSSTDLHAKLPHLGWSQVRPGDILWRPGHVGLYVGDGWAIHAPGRGRTVRYQPASKYQIPLRP